MLLYYIIFSRCTRYVTNPGAYYNWRPIAKIFLIQKWLMINAYVQVFKVSNKQICLSKWWKKEFMSTCYYHFVCI